MNTLFCAVVFSQALAFADYQRVAGPPNTAAALAEAAEEAADLDDMLKACGQGTKAAEIERVGRSLIAQARTLE